jgi:hypothetical protein
MSRVFGSDDKHSQRPILREPLPEPEQEEQEQEQEQEPVQIISNIDELAINTSRKEKKNYILEEFSKRGLTTPPSISNNLRKYVLINGSSKKSVNLNDIYISMRNNEFDWNRYSDDTIS